MTDHDIQKQLSREVIGQIKDDSIKSILRRILFDDKQKIDWNKVYEIMIEEMPELKLGE